MKKMLVVFVMLCIVSASRASLIDDFDRADSTDLGNGWIETAAGNGGSGGGTAPTAAIVSNQVEFNRAGWGPDAYVKIIQTFDASDEIGKASVDIALATNCTVGSNVVYTGLNIIGQGGSLEARFFVDSAANVGMGLWRPEGWVWGQVANDGNFNNLTFENSVVEGVEITSLYLNDSLMWQGTSIGDFTEVRVHSYWKGWVSGGKMYADNFEATTVPEPATLVILGLGAMFIRRKNS